MAMNKIERLDREIQKTREKITEYQNKLKELTAQKTEAEKPANRPACAGYAPYPAGAYRHAVRRRNSRYGGSPRRRLRRRTGGRSE